jgi:lipopolysaccharide export system protein LptA
VNAAILTFAAAALAFAVLPRSAVAQQIDLSHGGPISITSVDGIEWRQADHEVIARGDAKAVRGNVTVTADKLLAWYRKKAGAAGQQAAQPAQPAQAGQTGLTADTDTAGNEVYRLQAEGNVHIFTPTDMAQGDLATYDIDQAVLVLTGHNLRLTTPNDVLTARDDMEYWSAKHMAVARGDAVVVTKDGRRLAGDTLVAYTTAAPSSPAATPVAVKPDPNADALTSSGKLEKVEAFGHVSVRTVTDTVTGNRAVYVPATGLARVLGDVQITRGQNQLAGSEALVNLKTGVSRLLAGNTGRVQGLLVPNDQTNRSLMGPGPAPEPAKPAKP